MGTAKLRFVLLLGVEGSADGPEQGAERLGWVGVVLSSSDYVAARILFC